MRKDFEGVESSHFDRAIEEHDKSDPATFRRKVKIGRARTRYLGGRDLKAIAARAWQLAHRGKRLPRFNTIDAVARLEHLKYKAPPIGRNRRSALDVSAESFDASKLKDERKKVERQVKQRQGQHGFRLKLLHAYRRCAVTGERAEPVLQAAHIVQYLGPKTNDVRNGLLLRADVHNLFDKGLISIDARYRISVHSSLRGSTYADFKGRRIHRPKLTSHWPDTDALKVKLKLARQES